MSAVHDIHFPARLARGATGGPERRTEVLTLASGREIRNSSWAGSRRRWEVGSAIADLATLYELFRFFEDRRGRLYGFLFRDPVDHASAPPGRDVSPQDQVIGQGDGERRHFQLIKTYGSAVREIRKPRLATLQVAVDGVSLSSGWSFQTDTAEIVFDAPPLEGELISAGYEFDCIVRFERDQLDGIVETIGAGRVASVGLIELV